jgi:hypothetical protein
MNNETFRNHELADASISKQIEVTPYRVVHPGRGRSLGNWREPESARCEREHAEIIRLSAFFGAGEPGGSAA